MLHNVSQWVDYAMTIRLIATDVDGTLLNSHHQLTPRTEAALKAASAQGIPVILATGRARTARAVELIEQLGLQTPGIFLQGGAVHNADGSVRFQTLLADEIAEKIISIAQRERISLLAYCGYRIITARRNAHTDIVLRYGEPAPEEVGDLRNLLGNTPINKLVVFDEVARISAVRALFGAQLNGAVALVQTLPMSMELLPNGISKGVALRHLAQDYGIDMADVLALGDAENDIEMLQAVGVGVAMANAMQATKDVADHLTTSNDEDGVALAVERFVLA